MSNTPNLDYTKQMLAMHYLSLLAADQFLSAAMADLKRQGQGFRHEQKYKMNQLLSNAKALTIQYEDLFGFIYGLRTGAGQADMLRRDATFLARVGCKAMDRVAENPDRMKMVEGALERLRSGGLVDLDRIDREFIFR